MCVNPFVYNNIQKDFVRHSDIDDYIVFNHHKYKTRSKKNNSILRLNELSLFLHNIEVNDFLVKNNYCLIPCGVCVECLKQKKREWVQRNILEFKNNNCLGCFLTLTYDDDHIPKTDNNLFYTLRKRDLQLFFKRLRKSISSSNSSKKYILTNSYKIRYFACGEYGSKTYRPHYHILLYGIDFLNKKLFEKNKSGIYYICDDIRSLWNLGNHILTELTDFNICYTCGYTTKKINKNFDFFCFKNNIDREFTLMSRNPGIGYSDDFLKYYENDNFLNCFGSSRYYTKPLSYFDYKLKCLYPERYDEIKLNRFNDFYIDTNEDKKLYEINNDRDSDIAFSHLVDKL